MEIFVKNFEELTKSELYDLLQLRSEVFVVEQDCVYQDLDGKDQKALHVIGKNNNKIVTYTRVFRPGEYFQYSSIGRVVVREGHRKYNYGKIIMKASMKAIEENFKETTIHLSAQTYLKKFYNDLGFQETGREYLEDGIAHVRMVKK